MNGYLIDIPVQINIWIRPECQKKQFEIIRKVKPSTLILISDGGRNDSEWINIRNNRSMIENGIDWDCKVYKYYADENIGIKKMMAKTLEFVWERVDRCVFLEDDIIPNASFFRFCKEMLDRYENDFRINVVCGMNHLGIYQECSGDYFFSRQGSIWGYALWKRSYNPMYNYNYEKDRYILSNLHRNMKKDRWLWDYLLRIKKNHDNLFSPVEYFTELSMYSQNQLMIVPKKNMVCCAGATKDANAADALARLPKGVRRMYEMKTYEYRFPLKHPQFVFPDYKYERIRNRIVGRNHTMINLYRKMERVLYVLLDRDYSYLLKKLKG